MFVCQIYGGCYAMCYFSPFWTLISLFLAFWPFRWGVEIHWSRSTSVHLGLYQSVWIISFACLCLLVCFYALSTCYLSRSRLCHALCPLWVYACVVIFVLPKVCLDMTICEIHLWGVGVLVLQLSLLHAMLICLLCFLCATRLAILTSMLSCCTLAHFFMHESVCCPYFNPMELRTLDLNLHLSS